ncbi:MAG: hypothetical protein EIB84_05205 [Spiroplasma poulsonii]|uniref:Lipoprotein n=1 Tax=Spiroplasma poulsonii TaxID=2138 RepID=A0A2P6FBJ1_9MOLU|nr:hypothetical protein [Spiroplasma poulsonii]KAF0851240.1 putative lipoprotein [Spiroplasma poulsonii]MBW1242195.1 hypothetical protein [Spiroplasma poulsonii]PQM30835.1 hypothetical protein SMSRO_SF006260 [Spiroplasma poulsonii]PWF95826.1 hypothetical protein SMSE_12630 [Spiroplasma poulsonii]PWF98604.1 hypothetical protein SMH99_11660 [Spiroplasma poulsonii]
MPKILALLTATVLVSGSTASVIGCGTPSPSKINGKENLATEFTLTNNVIVTDDNIPVLDSIFEQAKTEQRIASTLTVDIFTVTDSANLEKPVNDNTPQEGYVVLIVRDDNDIPYIGSIIIHFTVIKTASIDLSQTIQLKDLWDITKYDSINDLYQDIWKVAVNDLQPDTPKSYDTYDMSWFKIPPVTFNQKLDVEMQAAYNGKANTPTAMYSGTIVIKLAVISYRAQVNLKLQQNNLPPDALYDLVWTEVKKYFATDVRVSNDRNDYLIDWNSVTEPPVGEAVYLYFLATPKDENAHHYIRAVGGVTKYPILLPPTIKLTVPVVVTQRERPNVNKDYIWAMEMQEANLVNGPELKDFDVTSWTTTLNQNWPSISGSRVVTLNAINLNTNPMFKGDVAIEVELINQGTAISLLPVDSILLVRQDHHTVDSVLNLVWNNVINTPEWGPSLSNQLSNFRIKRKDDLKRALEATERNGDWATYVISILGNQEDGSGRDVDVLVQGKIKMIDNPITVDLPIDLTSKNYRFNATKLETWKEQGSYFKHQIWKDVIKQPPFVDQNELTFGISKNEADWNVTELGTLIGEAIKNYDPNTAKDISLQFDLMLLNPTNYGGKITLDFKLTPGIPTAFGDIDLTNKVEPIFVRKLPATEDEKTALLVKIMETLLDQSITKNPALHNKYPNVPLDLNVYNAFTNEVLNELVLPIATDSIKESIITIQPNIPVFEGTVKLKVKLIYQP